MNQIMTITLPDGSTLTGTVTERILSHDNHFFNFEVSHNESGQNITVRVDDKEQYDDMKKRGRI